MITNHPGNPNGAFTIFLNNSNAGTATIVSEGEGPGNSGVQFRGHSSADQSTIIGGGGGVGQAGQIATFTDYTTAGSATIIANGGTQSGAPGSLIIFYSFLGGAATAENSTLIANSGSNGGLGGLQFAFAVLRRWASCFATIDLSSCGDPINGVFSASSLVCATRFSLPPK